MNLGLLKRCLAAESLNALSQSSSVPVSNAPVAPTTTVAGVSSSSSVPCVPSVNELLATEQANSSALMKSLQDLYRVLVREALDLEASGTANSSSNSNIDVATLLLNRCVKYEGTFKKLELERDQAKTRVAELEKRLIDVYQLSSSVTLLSQINNHQLSSSSAANDTRVSFESNHVDRQAGRETAINSEGATSLASGMSAPLSIASSLPDSNAAKLKRKHRQEADEDSQLTERLSNHSVPYSSNKQGRQAE